MSSPLPLHRRGEQRGGRRRRSAAVGRGRRLGADHRRRRRRRRRAARAEQEEPPVHGGRARCETRHLAAAAQPDPEEDPGDVRLEGVSGGGGGGRRGGYVVGGGFKPGVVKTLEDHSCWEQGVRVL